MIGDMIAKIRKEKGITKTELARLTDINIGHLTHIEKGERNPSHKALRNICSALDVPYQQLMFTYDKNITEDQEKYEVIKHISHNRVLAIDKIGDFIECPSRIPSSAVAVKMNDDSMEPRFKKDSYVFVEFNSPLNHREFGIFNVNGKIIIRRFLVRKNKVGLSAENESYEEIDLKDSDEFYITGKIYQ